jgi:hypothetical protein
MKAILLLGLLLSIGARAAEDIDAVQMQLEGAPPVSDAVRGRWAFGMGIESRMFKQMSSSVDYDQTTWPSVFFSYREKWYQSSFEASAFEDKSATGAFQTRFERRELRHWARYLFYKNKSWSPFLGLGLGVFQEAVTTTFYDEVERKQTHLKTTGGAELGLQGFFYKRLFAGLNFRALRDFPEGPDEWNWVLQLQLGFSPL